MATARGFHIAGLLSNGKVLAASGFSATYTPTDEFYMSAPRFT